MVNGLDIFRAHFAPSVQKDMDAFLTEFFNEKPDLSNLKISSGWDSIMQALQIVFRGA